MVSDVGAFPPFSILSSSFRQCRVALSCPLEAAIANPTRPSARVLRSESIHLKRGRMRGSLRGRIHLFEAAKTRGDDRKRGEGGAASRRRLRLRSNDNSGAAAPARRLGDEHSLGRARRHRRARQQCRGIHLWEGERREGKKERNKGFKLSFNREW